MESTNGKTAAVKITYPKIYLFLKYFARNFLNWLQPTSTVSFIFSTFPSSFTSLSFSSSTLKKNNFDKNDNWDKYEVHYGSEVIFKATASTYFVYFYVSVE